MGRGAPVERVAAAPDPARMGVLLRTLSAGHAHDRLAALAGIPYGRVDAASLLGDDSRSGLGAHLPSPHLRRAVHLGCMALAERGGPGRSDAVVKRTW